VGKTLLGGWPISGGINYNNWYIAIGGVIESVANENNYKTRFRTAGMLSNFLLRVASNTCNATRTWRVKKNGSNGNLAVTVPALTSGKFEDNSNSDSIAVDDDVYINIPAGGTTGNTKPDVVSFVFSANVNTVSKWIAGSFFTFNDGPETTYQPVTGWLSDSSNDTDEEATIYTKIHSSGTWKSLAARISKNNRGNTSTIRSRKNGANGSQALSIPAGTTGIFVDTTNTDSISDGDIVDYSVTLGNNDADLTIYTISSEFETSDNTGHLVTGDSDPTGQAIGSVAYLAINGYTDPLSTEIGTRVTVPFACVWSKLSVMVEGNGISTGNVIFRTRKNGANGTQSVTIPPLTSGFFEDLTHSDSIDANDDINYQSVATGTSGGSIGYGSISSSISVSLSRSLFISKAMFTASK
jgi:hypothetical protein